MAPAPKALILGVGGLRLDVAERAFFHEADPLGFILFARNVEGPEQVRTLVADLRDTVGRAGAPVLVDQEGGRVARLKPPHWRAAPSAAVFGRLARTDREAACRATYLNARLIGAELAALGITVDCAPVLDVPTSVADPVIGDRAFAGEPEPVALLGAAFCDGLIDSGVLPVIKHIPGHGRAEVDSHKRLPRIDAKRTELASRDFAPFRALAARAAPEPWAMTAHVVYEAYDEAAPATLSPAVLSDVVRGEIGFDGIIISDDLSMGALSGVYGDRTQGALAAGCDIALHCNGDMTEMAAVAAAAGPVGGVTAARLARSIEALDMPAPFDAAAARAELERLLAPLAGNAA